MKKILNIIIIPFLYINVVNAAHYTVKREVATVSLSKDNTYTINLKKPLNIQALWQKTSYYFNTPKSDSLEKRYLAIVRSMDGGIEWNESEAATNKEILLVVQALEFLVQYKSSYVPELYMNNRLVRDAESIIFLFVFGIPASVYVSQQASSLSFKEKIAILTQRLHPIAAFENYSAIKECKRMRDVILDKCAKYPQQSTCRSILLQCEVLLDYVQTHEHKIYDIDFMLKMGIDIMLALIEINIFRNKSMKELIDMYYAKIAFRAFNLKNKEEFDQLVDRIEL